MISLQSKFYKSIKFDLISTKILWIHNKKPICSQNFVDPQTIKISGYGTLLFHKILNVNISSKVTELLRFKPAITDIF